MNAQLAVVGARSSQPVIGPDGAPLDLTNFSLPSSVRGTEVRRLFRALGEALREMRVRQRQIPADSVSALRLGIIATAENGTDLEVHTGSTNLRTIDLEAERDRETVLAELRSLEQTFLERG